MALTVADSVALEPRSRPGRRHGHARVVEWRGCRSCVCCTSMQATATLLQWSPDASCELISRSSQHDHTRWRQLPACRRATYRLAGGTPGSSRPGLQRLGLALPECRVIFCGRASVVLVQHVMHGVTQAQALRGRRWRLISPVYISVPGFPEGSRNGHWCSKSLMVWRPRCYTLAVIVSAHAGQLDQIGARASSC